jgi:hypothetical protein
MTFGQCEFFGKVNDHRPESRWSFTYIFIRLLDFYIPVPALGIGGGGGARFLARFHTHPKTASKTRTATRPRRISISVPDISDPPAAPEVSVHEPGAIVLQS